MPSAEPMASRALRLPAHVALAAMLAAACSSPPEPSGRPPNATVTPSTSRRDTVAGLASKGIRRASADTAEAPARGNAVSLRLDTLAARMDTVQVGVRNLSRSLWSVRTELRRRWIRELLMLGAGFAAGLALSHLVARWRRRQRGSPAMPGASAPPDRALDLEKQALALRADREAERARSSDALVPSGGQHAPRYEGEDLARRLDRVEDSVTMLTAEFRALRAELRRRPLATEPGSTGAQTPHAARPAVRMLPEGGEALTPHDPGDDDAGAGNAAGLEERIDVLLNEEGIFVRYPEPVNRPMAEIVWRRGDPEAYGYILPTFLFSLDSRRLQIAYDVDHLDSGRYQTETPARVHWGDSADRGRVRVKGKLRYAGT